MLRVYRRIAVVGLSANEMRPSYFVARYMLSAGYEIIPVNPGEKSILDRECFPNLRAIPCPVDIVDIFRAPAAVPGIVDEAIAIGAKVVWMQFGVIHEEAAQRALDAGLEVVMDRCLKVEHARFFGRLTQMGLNSGVISSRKCG
jgi:uncharacterized protein